MAKEKKNDTKNFIWILKLVCGKTIEDKFKTDLEIFNQSNWK